MHIPTCFLMQACISLVRSRAPQPIAEDGGYKAVAHVGAALLERGPADGVPSQREILHILRPLPLDLAVHDVFDVSTDLWPSLCLCAGRSWHSK